MRKTGRSGCDQDRCGACRVESWGTLWNLTNSLERAESQGLGHKTNQAIVLCQKGLNDFFVISALCNFELKK